MDMSGMTQMTAMSAGSADYAATHSDAGLSIAACDSACLTDTAGDCAAVGLLVAGSLLLLLLMRRSTTALTIAGRARRSLPLWRWHELRQSRPLSLSALCILRV